MDNAPGKVCSYRCIFLLNISGFQLGDICRSKPEMNPIFFHVFLQCFSVLDGWRAFFPRWGGGFFSMTCSYDCIVWPLRMSSWISMLGFGIGRT